MPLIISAGQSEAKQEKYAPGISFVAFLVRYDSCVRKELVEKSANKSRIAAKMERTRIFSPSPS